MQFQSARATLGRPALPLQLRRSVQRMRVMPRVVAARAAMAGGAADEDPYQVRRWRLRHGNQALSM